MPELVGGAIDTLLLNLLSSFAGIRTGTDRQPDLRSSRRVDLARQENRETNSLRLLCRSGDEAVDTQAGGSNPAPCRPRSRESPRIEWVNSKLPKASANALFGGPVKAIKDLFGFVRDADSKIHRPRSRS
jgi:hypothetical protein